MPFLTGKTTEVAPEGFKDFRKELFDFLRSQGFETALTGAPSAMDIGPYREAFAQRRAETLAQAKEGAGNLTGSGFANIYGAAAGRSVAEENAFLADLQERSRQASAQRFMGLLGLPTQYAGQVAYQPGFLDYLFSGAKAAAPFLSLGAGASAAAGGGGGGAAPAGFSTPGGYFG